MLIWEQTEELSPEELYELDLEDRAAQEDAENDSLARGYLGR